MQPKKYCIPAKKKIELSNQIQLLMTETLSKQTSSAVLAQEENLLDWNEVLKKLKITFGNDIYESWIRNINLKKEFNHYVVLSAPTRFVRDWIVSRYADKILDIIKIFKRTIQRIEFLIEESKVIPDKIDFRRNNQISSIENSLLNYNRFNINNSFDNFMVGESNELAYTAARKVCVQSSHYNPLFIYSAVGMGKTHLLNAIGLDIENSKKVMFISAERFMYHFIRSIKSNDMVKFKDFFRKANVFIIDDIQFVAGKEAMQEEFFHTFNALLDKGSQVILSADRAPNKLSRIQERIKSRFAGGLVVDIQKPDYDLRQKIVKTKIDELNVFYSNEVNISNEIQKFISLEIKTSIRELVGAINRIVSFSRIYNKIPNVSETKVILKDLLNLSENRVTIDLIQSIVCKFFKISKNEMLSSRRSRYLVRPRQTAIYLTKILTSKSLPEIGREFSNRDHTTIIHSVKTIEKLKEDDTELSTNIDNLKNQILYNKENEI